MGSNIYSASLSGMNAAQFALSTTQHNIANANTPGYSRQTMLVNSRAAQATGAGFVGQGVDVTGVVRNYDQFLTTQVRQEQTQASYLSTYLTSMKQIDNMVADPAAGVSPAIQNFFNATNALASNPESIPARQTVLSTAEATVNRFQAMDQRLTDISNSLTTQIASSVQTVNTYATQIATLNNSIKSAIATAQGQQPNDLLDQRDQLVNLLNKEIKVSTQQQTDGSMSVFVGNGQALVVGDQAMALQVVQNPADPSKVDVAYLNNGKSVTMQQSSLQGGNLGAYLTFRDQSLEPARNALGRVALGLATNINQQNQMGLDLNGALGASIFKDVLPRVDKGLNNAGAGVLTATISNMAAVTTSDYQLKFDGANYTMTRMADNQLTNLGTAASVMPLTQVVDGVSVVIPAGMFAGDSFLIRPVANAARDMGVLTTDPTKLATAAPMISTTATTNTGTGVITAGSVNTPLPLNANLQVPVTITFTSATSYTVTGALPAVAGAVAYTEGVPITYNGWTATITGTPAAGDVFNVKSNTTATGDNRNALLMAALQTQNLLASSGGVGANATTNLQGAYSQFVGSIGAKTQELLVTSTAQDAMVTQTVATQQSVSGVNLDEEAANLLRYQRAYQAAAKAMQIANTMFDSLLTLGR
ncbi:flagellar hook-associated protein FlgK [Gallionella capsiferriformans]|uniref:Flagellar hook-associated protein 1 n=1 Tax=Gallionella capsiferriformans (strain ES-2) TaxID=395494 RepID=D9SEY5_GALCS|nr:flagellar hook-associated protein FlgK [Gallionella capsiferriformans]ADL55082.1 flagellar hook-associated protein FlgK [Gallionella capsiferriformans ES-2]